MADVIFTTGTCPKTQMYTTMINAFIAAGWTNISSNPTTDFDILRSPGESGDKALIIQIRPTNITNVNSTLTTDFSACSYRLIENYVPGASGTAGTIARSAETWTALMLVPVAATVTTAQTTILTYFINVNKNRMIIAIETPQAIGIGPITHYIGLPDAYYASEPGSRGFLVATTAYPKTNNTIHITNTPQELASDALSSTRTIYCQLAPKNPNSAGLISFSEMMYGNATEGFRGKLNGLYALPSGGLLNGDIINVGDKKFRALLNQTVASQNSFPTSVLAIQIA